MVMDRSVRISLTAWPTLPLTATLTEKNVIYTRQHMRIELASGTEAEVDALVALLRGFGIKELVQSGMVAIGRGSRSISERSLRPVAVPAPPAIGG